MTVPINLTETAIFTALVTVLGTFGLASSNPGQPVPIVRGQINRVPSPAQTDYVVIWPLFRNRFATNVDTYTDTYLTGSITDSVLTVTKLDNGPLVPGIGVIGAGVTSGASIARQLTGDAGQVGTYQMTPCADVASTMMWAGTAAAMQETEIVVQADVHGPASADNAQRISTLFRDDFACEAFSGLTALISPLYTSDPRQIPFETGEQQTDERWSIDLHMQADITVTTGMQFAEQLTAQTLVVETIQ
jgi:hypothetical protein